ncbi:MAG: hypothetical protein KKF48_05635, partial [Nanoarchaeota archaeon]|nr:hypothetical protein [Nanoarchaeota archaeon]
LVVSITIILKNYILQEVTMVKIEDITEDSKGLEFALSLVRTSFNGAYNVFFEQNSSPPNLISVMAKFGRRISSINLKEGNLILYDKDYLENANAFATVYEPFLKSEKDFVIKTDYSGLFSQRK